MFILLLIMAIELSGADCIILKESRLLQTLQVFPNVGGINHQFNPSYKHFIFILVLIYVCIQYSCCNVLVVLSRFAVIVVVAELLWSGLFCSLHLVIIPKVINPSNNFPSCFLAIFSFPFLLPTHIWFLPSLPVLFPNID